MFGRIGQLARHFSHPLQGHIVPIFPPRQSSICGMAPSADVLQRSTKTIHTAACLIIGDEVLGGKVCYYLVDLLLC
jgi:hypothetical protein